LRSTPLYLSAQDIALFRALVKPAAAYLLMLSLGHPITAHDLAAILGIPEQTSAEYLRTLLSLNLIVWDEHENHYLLNERNLIIPSDGIEPFVQGEPDHRNGVDLPAWPRNPMNKSWVHSSKRTKQVWQELISAGVSLNPRTRELVRQHYVTPEYVRAHRLKMVASGKSGPQWAGLLVTILESGEPAPPLNPNGHLETCDCLDCHGYKVAKSWEDPY
jgi:hypothetical protein